MIFLAENFWLSHLRLLVVDPIRRSRTEASVVHQLAKKIEITPSRIIWCLVIGFIVPMAFLALAAASPPESQSIILTALVITIPPLIICGGKIADLIDRLVKKEFKQTRILGVLVEDFVHNTIDRFCSTTFSPPLPPPRLSLG